MLDHLDDLASDFSAIHGIKDITALDGPTFLRMAYRIGCYQGVMRDLVMAESRQESPQAPSAPQWQTAGDGPRAVVGGSRAELQTAPEFAGVFSFSKAG